MFLPTSSRHGIEVTINQRWVSAAGTLLFVILVAACMGCRQAANLTEVQRVRSGAVDIVLLSRDGALHQKDPFTIEFRSAPGGKLVAVGTVRANATMPMPGMPMFGTIDVRPADAPGRYTAKGNLDMTGGWRIALEWDGPTGGSSKLHGNSAMKSTLNAVFVRNLVVVLATQVAVFGATDVTVGGTMVVAVRFREGLVVCADKRSHLDGPGLPKGNYRDDDVKITLINQKGGL